MSHDIILTFASGLGAALLLGYLAHRVGLSPIVGYLLGGILVGPHTPGFVASTAIAEEMAELGIMLLMFGVGLRFHLHELLAVWRVAVPGAMIQSLASTAMTAVALHLMGWAWTPALVLGLAISVASTVVLIRVLTDSKDLHTGTGHIAVGWVVVEDLLTIGLLVMLPVLAGSPPSDGTAATSGGGVVMTMAVSLLKVAACIVLIVAGGGRVIPWCLDKVARMRSGELFTLAVLAIALGIAVGSALLFGVSLALGAFLAGLVVGRTEFAARAAADALPMRDAFAVMFFVSVGMLFDPGHLLAEPVLIGVVLAIVMIGKPIAAIAVTRLAGRPWAIAVPVGLSLGQIGEFTFILGTAARGLGLLDLRAWNTLVAVAMISIAVNPSLYRWARRFSATPASTPPPPAGGAASGDGSCIVVGYGPVGRHIVHALTSHHLPVTVIEMNLATVRELRASGVAVVYGDATRWETLAQADLDTASTLVISSDMADPGETVRLARARRPDLRVMARCSHLSGAGPLRTLGAEVVVAGEGEIAISLTEAVLSAAGADAETVAKTRASVRAAVLATSGG
jgi:CPA2 family monovalent cation:H+ antiporter-2